MTSGCDTILNSLSSTGAARHLFLMHEIIFAAAWANACSVPSLVLKIICSGPGVHLLPPFSSLATKRTSSLLVKMELLTTLCEKKPKEPWGKKKTKTLNERWKWWITIKKSAVNVATHLIWSFIKRDLTTAVTEDVCGTWALRYLWHELQFADDVELLAHNFTSQSALYAPLVPDIFNISIFYRYLTHHLSCGLEFLHLQPDRDKLVITIAQGFRLWLCNMQDSALSAFVRSPKERK